MGRAPCCDKTKVKRGPWSPEEDYTLKNYVETHGTGGNWIALPHKAGLKRCGKSCRLRWLNYLRPNIKHGGFTEEEDNIILSLYHTIGSRWSVIASQLPGRTDNDVKNYWNTKLKKKLLQPAAPGPSQPSTVVAATGNYMTSTNYTSHDGMKNFSLSFDNMLSPYFPTEANFNQELYVENRYDPAMFPHQESASTLSSSSFSVDHNGSWTSSSVSSTNGLGEDEAILDELLMPYDLMNAFDYAQEKYTQMQANDAYSPYSDLFGGLVAFEQPFE